MTHKLDKLFKKKSEVQVIQRRLDDNLKVRKYRRELKEVEQKMKDLRSEIKTFNRGSIEAQDEELKNRHMDFVREVINEIKSSELD